MDRSLWSTLAVHYAHDPARMETLFPLFELAADRLAVPDLTIVLEADAETCRQRIARKSGAEQELDAASPSDEAFRLREREFYHWLSDQGLKVVFLDANDGTPEDVCRRAAQLIREVVAMLLLTSNPRKYGPLADVLAGMQISLRKPDFDLPELQDLDFEAVVAHKAKTAAEALGTLAWSTTPACCWTPTPVFPAP